MTKARAILQYYHPDLPEFPLDDEALEAAAPYPGAVPTSLGQLVDLLDVVA